MKEYKYCRGAEGDTDHYLVITKLWEIFFRKNVQNRFQHRKIWYKKV